MKRLIYGMMVVLITAISCEKNDIKGYNEAPRLEFFNTKAECVFDDRDYINEVTERALGVKVRCLGYALEKPLNFCPNRKFIRRYKHNPFHLIDRFQAKIQRLFQSISQTTRFYP